MKTYGQVSKMTKGHGGAKFDVMFTEYTGIPLNQMQTQQPLAKKR